jgi:NAD(P)-dependent dehydrogenase (short-subunit alcohol dehydrogenase family)
MSEKSAIITGAGRGIGRAAAIELSRRGYRVALVSRTEKQLIETASLCTESDLFPADVSDPAAVKKIVGEIHSRYHRIGAVVHCAGVAPSIAPEKITDHEWREIIDTNLSAVVYLARELWPIWKKQGGGAMVNVSSYAAREPFEGLGAYGAAKAGVNLLGHALAKEGAPHHIRVHTVAPAATETAMFRKLLTPEQFPKDRTLDPVEVGRVIADCVCGSLTITSGEVVYVHKM